MGFGMHPNELSGLYAQKAANTSGHPPDSAGWLQAYRDAYDKSHQAAAGEERESLDAMLADLDRQIAALRAGETGGE